MAHDTTETGSAVLREELKSLVALENWGATLFLGAIALVSKQLVDWQRPLEGGKSVTLNEFIFLLPAVFGLFAFIFLRVVNFRIRYVRARLFKLTQLTDSRRFSFGTLGWLMALMPAAFGYAATCYFSLDHVRIRSIFCVLLWAGLIVFGGAVGVFTVFSQDRQLLTRN
jgi:hypothetical protein